MVDQRALSDVERQIIQEREARDTLLRNEARTVRNRLEKGAPQSPRIGIVAFLNGIAEESASRELPPIAALEALRRTQELNRRAPEQHNLAHARFMRAVGGVEGLDRLCPLSRRTPSPGARQMKPLRSSITAGGTSQGTRKEAGSSRIRGMPQL